MERRNFLKGTSLGVGSIYLSQFFNDLHANEKQTNKPCRILFFVQGNGLYPNEITPSSIPREKSHTTLQDIPLKGHTLPISMQPLTPWQDKITIIHGLSSVIARKRFAL